MAVRALSAQAPRTPSSMIWAEFVPWGVVPGPARRQGVVAVPGAQALPRYGNDWRHTWWGVVPGPARPQGVAAVPASQAPPLTKVSGGSVWESNPACPARGQQPVLKTGRATGPRSLP